MIRLTTPAGTIYVRKEIIVSFHEAYIEKYQSKPVRTRLYVAGRAESFNVLEDVETVYSLMKQQGTEGDEFKKSLMK